MQCWCGEDRYADSHWYSSWAGCSTEYGGHPCHCHQDEETAHEDGPDLSKRSWHIFTKSALFIYYECTTSLTIVIIRVCYHYCISLRISENHTHFAMLHSADSLPMMMPHHFMWVPKSVSSLIMRWHAKYVGEFISTVDISLHAIYSYYPDLRHLHIKISYLMLSWPAGRSYEYLCAEG